MRQLYENSMEMYINYAIKSARYSYKRKLYKDALNFLNECLKYYD
jgi:hypothetical protein